MIERIINRKKSREGLAEDLNQMSKRVIVMNEWLNKAHASNADLSIGKIERIIDLLTIHNSIIYKKFLVGIDSIIDTYLD